MSADRLTEIEQHDAEANAAYAAGDEFDYGYVLEDLTWSVQRIRELEALIKDVTTAWNLMGELPELHYTARQKASADWPRLARALNRMERLADGALDGEA